MIALVINALRIIFGLFFILFVPGIFLSLIVFKKDSIMKKMAFSCVFSIVITLFLAIVLDLSLGVDITAENIIISLSIVTTIFFVIWVFQPENYQRIRKFRRKW